MVSVVALFACFHWIVLVQVRGVVAGLEYIHGLSVVHGDLKPVSIVLDTLPELTPTIGQYPGRRFGKPSHMRLWAGEHPRC